MLTEKQVVRFWSYVEITDQCWPWKGRDFVGPYARFYWGGIRTYVHRMAYFIEHGELDDGKVIHHTCGNKLCVRPDHLEEITQSEHVIAHGWGALETCKHGHPWVSENVVRKRDGRLRCLECRRRDGREAQRRRRERSTAC